MYYKHVRDLMLWSGKGNFVLACCICHLSWEIMVITNVAHCSKSTFEVYGCTLKWVKVLTEFRPDYNCRWWATITNSIPVGVWMCSQHVWMAAPSLGFCSEYVVVLCWSPQTGSMCGVDHMWHLQVVFLLISCSWCQSDSVINGLSLDCQQEV